MHLVHTLVMTVTEKGTCSRQNNLSLNLTDRTSGWGISRCVGRMNLVGVMRSMHSAGARLLADIWRRWMFIWYCCKTRAELQVASVSKGSIPSRQQALQPSRRRL